MPSLSDGLVLHFTFDDAGLQNAAPNGPAVALIPVRGFHGAAITIETPGRVGTGYTTIGRYNQYTIPGVAVVFSGVRQLTWSAWFKPSTITDWSHLFMENELKIYCTNTGGIEVQTNAVASDRVYTGLLVLDRWTHIAVALDILSNTAWVYIDGELAGQQWVSTTTNDFTEFRIGTVDDKGIQGSIDDVRLYNRILSAEEVAALCPRDMRGLIFHAPYDVDAGDYSGYGRVATQIDAPYSFNGTGRVGRSGAMTPASLASVSYSPTFGVTDASMASGLAFSGWVQLISGKHVTSVFRLQHATISTAYMHLYVLSTADGDIGNLAFQ
ncbi:concanavalin A-like lectin/glucanase domain-containing protein, partial [Baffinella frigidus]